MLNLLTDAACKGAKANAKGADKPRKMPDGGGLHLYVTPAGGTHWRLRYEFSGKEKTLTFGPYPDVSLKDARDKRTAAKALLREGRDPALEKRLARLHAAAVAEQTFEAAARRWYEQAAPTWTERHAADVLGSLVQDVFPKIGDLPLSRITPPMVLQVLRPIEARPALETARRIRQRISAVFVFAIASGQAEADPAAIVKGAMAADCEGASAGHRGTGRGSGYAGQGRGGSGASAYAPGAAFPCPHVCSARRSAGRGMGGV